MAIFIGRRPEAGFTRVPNEWARDPKLTTKAKGLLTYLLSHQDGYQLSLKQVIAENADGRDAIYKTLAELVERGYLRRDQRRGERGKVGEVDYRVADSPQVETASGFTASGESGSGDDQGKQDVSAGGTASWNAVSGVAVSGKPDTKKTRVKKTKNQEDQKTTSPSPSAPGSALVVVEAEIVEEEDGTSSFELQLQNLLDEIRRTRPNWSAADLRTYINAATSMLGESFEAAAEVARRTAKDPTTAHPSRITAAGNPHLRDASTALLLARIDSADPAPSFGQPHAKAHPFEADGSGISCKRCGTPVQNGMHKVGNQGGGYVAQRNTSINTKPRYEPWRQPEDQSEYDQPFSGQVARSPADQRVLDNLPLYNHYKALEG